MEKDGFDNADIYELECILKEFRENKSALGMTCGDAIERIEKIAFRKNIGLTERTKYMILDGAKTTGSMIEGFHYVCESLYTDEFEDVKMFCEWIDKNVGGCGDRNIDRLYECWKNPTEENNQYVKELSERINKYKIL